MNEMKMMCEVCLVREIDEVNRNRMKDFEMAMTPPFLTDENEVLPPFAGAMSDRKCQELMMSIGDTRYALIQYENKEISYEKLKEAVYDTDKRARRAMYAVEFYNRILGWSDNEYKRIVEIGCDTND